MDEILKKREKYLSKIRPFYGKNLVKIITGQRRTGKSMIMRSIFEEITTEKNTPFLIDLERAEWSHIRNADDLYAAAKGKAIVGIDEVQEIPSWEKAVRYLVADGADVYITGSNAHLLSGELATLLAGRHIKIEVWPLDYREYLEFHDSVANEDSLFDYLARGGLPYLTLLTPGTATDAYLRDVFDSIALRDVIARHNIRNVDFFRRLLRFAAEQCGTPFSAKSVSDFLQSQRVNMRPNIAIEYLRHAQDAYLLRGVNRRDIRGKKTFEIRQKYYFTDLGIRQAAIGTSQRPDPSSTLENAVFCHLASYGWSVMTGDISGHEIDFIAEKEGKTAYFQVAFRIDSVETAQREFGALAAIRDAWPKTVLSLGRPGPGRDGIRHENLVEWLRVAPSIEKE